MFAGDNVRTIGLSLSQSNQLVNSPYLRTDGGVTCVNDGDVTSPEYQTPFATSKALFTTMLVNDHTFCGVNCFLRTVAADEGTGPSATVTVLFFATGCVVPHLVISKTDAYLDLHSVWNVNVDRWLGENFIRFADYSEDSFGVRGWNGMNSMSYKYTARFLPQDSVGVVNELLASLCCGRMGVWFGNLVLIGHESGSGEALTVSWNAESRTFEWTADLSRSTTRRARSLCVEDVPDAVFLLSK